MDSTDLDKLLEDVNSLNIENTIGLLTWALNKRHTIWPIIFIQRYVELINISDEPDRIDFDVLLDYIIDCQYLR